MIICFEKLKHITNYSQFCHNVIFKGLLQQIWLTYRRLMWCLLSFFLTDSIFVDFWKLFWGIFVFFKSFFFSVYTLKSYFLGKELPFAFYDASPLSGTIMSDTHLTCLPVRGFDWSKITPYYSHSRPHVLCPIKAPSFDFSQQANWKKKKAQKAWINQTKLTIINQTRYKTRRSLLRPI